MNFLDKRFFLLVIIIFAFYLAYKTLAYLKWAIILLIVVFVFYKAKNLLDFRYKLFQIIDYLPLPRGIQNLIQMIKGILNVSIPDSEPQEQRSSKTKHQKRRVTGLQKKYVASKQKWKCNSCQKLLDYSYEVDHIVPLYQGGNNTTSNLQALCPNCHGKKTIKDALH